MLTRSLTGLAILLALTPAVFAQPKPSGGREGVSRSFDSASPGIGRVLPDVMGYDADGNEFHLRDLKGHYSVLVFGCLT